MIKNYLKTAFRSLLRNRSNTFINVLGLSIGVAACLLIFLVLRFEKSYDTFNKNYNRIYRIVLVDKRPEGTKYTAGVPFPVANGLKNEYPELQKVASIYSVEGQINVLDGLNSGQKFEEKEGIFYADPQFFEIFDFQWLSGNPVSSLSSPNSAVISKKFAEKYFTNWQDAIGKTIKFENRYVYRITGILKDVPANSDFQLGIVFSFISLNDTEVKRNLDDWLSIFSNYNCYVLFPPGLSKNQFESFLVSFNNKHKQPEYQKNGLAVQPLSEVHYDNRFGNFSHHIFSYELITALTLIGIFLLVIACVNFINLSTAQAVNRSREVGVRKVLGSSRLQLVMQFISETLLITLSSIFLAVVIVEVLINSLQNLIKINLGFNIFTDFQLAVFLFVLVIIITVLSGFYPAMVLSGFNPAEVLKNSLKIKRKGGVTLRRALVVFQFVIAQVMIIAMLAVISQMNYFKTASLGFDKDQVMLVPIPSDSVSVSKASALKYRLLSYHGIKNVSLSAFGPIDNRHWDSDFKFDKLPVNSEFTADLKWADVDYFKTYNISFIAGRPYQNSDSVKGFVVNETLVKKLGIQNPGDILGKEINFWYGQIVAPVVGVVKDFNSSPMRSAISPVVLAGWKDVYSLLNIKLASSALTSSMQTVKKYWESTYPEYVYNYTFLDEKVDNFYKTETTLSVLYSVFAGIAIFISCLGLYGLISFMTIQRTKEVGIRKVLGASAGNIIFLFSKEFTLLITISFILASPIAYIIMQGWLDKFAYRINLGPGIFLLTILSSLFVAWLAVGYRAIRAANANPVNSLRYE